MIFLSKFGIILRKVISVDEKNNNEQSVNTFLKDFFDTNYNENKLLFDNMQNIYALISFLYNNMRELNIEEQNLRDGKRTSVVEIERIIDVFYKSIGVDFKFNEIIKDGTFNIISTNNPKKTSNYKLYSGNNNYYIITEYLENPKSKEKTIIYEGIHKTINVYNNTLVTDSIIWVHEISHYRNQPPLFRGEVNDILTELLAFTEEFIYTDYLEQIGYEKEARMFKIEEYKNLHTFIQKGYYIVRIFLLYFLLGEVSQENYEFLYKEDKNYEYALKFFDTEIIKSQNKDRIFTILFYSVGIISIYNYVEYKNSPIFLEKIEKLNEEIMNDNISLEDALKIIDIKFEQESLDKVLEDINIFREDLIKRNKARTK